MTHFFRSFATLLGIIFAVGAWAGDPPSTARHPVGIGSKPMPVHEIDQDSARHPSGTGRKPMPVHIIEEQMPADTPRTEPAQAGSRPTEAVAQHAAHQASVMRREAFAGFAQAASLAPLDPQASGQTTLNISAATYGGQTAMGVVVAHRAGSITFSAGAASAPSSSRTLVRVTAGWRF